MENLSSVEQLCVQRPRHMLRQEKSNQPKRVAFEIHCSYAWDSTKEEKVQDRQPNLWIYPKIHRTNRLRSTLFAN